MKFDLGLEKIGGGCPCQLLVESCCYVRPRLAFVVPQPNPPVVLIQLFYESLLEPFQTLDKQRPILMAFFRLDLKLRE